MNKSAIIKTVTSDHKLFNVYDFVAYSLKIDGVETPIVMAVGYYEEDSSKQLTSINIEKLYLKKVLHD